MKNFLDKNLAFLILIFLAILGGGLGVFVKIGVKEIPPVIFTFLRFILATVVLFPFAVKEMGRFKGIYRSLFGVSLLGTANVTLFAIGVRYTTAISSQLIYIGTPVVAAVFSYFLLRESLTGRKVLGILLGLLGVLIIILIPAVSRGNPNFGSLLGNTIVLTAMICFSIYSVISKKIQKVHSPLLITFSLAITTSLSTLILSLTEFAKTFGWWKVLSPITLFSLFYVGVLGTALYYLLYQYAIKKASATAASMAFYIQPAAAIVWAYFLLGEKLSLAFVLGATLSLLGAWITTQTKSSTLR